MPFRDHYVSRGGAELIDFLNSPPVIQNQGSNDNCVDNIRNTRKERMISPRFSLSMSHSNDSEINGGGGGGGGGGGVVRRGSQGRGRQGGKGPLDDPTFAPPPLLPEGQMKASYLLNAEREANYAKLPRYEKIRHSGNIMTRFSAVSLLTKKWSQNFWILYSNCLYFFRSKDDFEAWLFNPYLTKEGRQALVKRYLDFDSSQASLFRLDKIGLKYYRKGGMMHHFKLDKYYAQGPSNTLHLVAAFSSINQNDVIELHTILSKMLKKAGGRSTNTDHYHLTTTSETHSAYSSTYSMTDGRNSVASAGF